MRLGPVLLLLLATPPAAAGVDLWQVPSRQPPTDGDRSLRGEVARALAATSAGMPSDFAARLDRFVRAARAARVDAETAELLAVYARAVGRPDLAIAVLRDGRDRASDPHSESRLSRRLAEQLAVAGRYEDALWQLDRHLRIGVEVTPESHMLYGGVELARGRADAAAARFRTAVTLAETEPAPTRPSLLARALYGLAVAEDVLGQPMVAREVGGRALIYDGGGALRASVCSQDGSSADLDEAGRLYLCGMLAEWLGDRDGAAASYGRVEGTSGMHSAARARLERLRTREGTGAGRWRVVARATVAANGPLPAPLIDASVDLWMERRPELFRDCLEPPPVVPGRALRVRVQVVLASTGRIVSANATDGPVDRCFADKLRSLAERPPGGQPLTRAQIEFVLAPAGTGLM